MHIGPVEAVALLDSGAMINCVSHLFLEALKTAGAKIDIRDNNIGDVGTANREGSLNCTGRVKLPCRIGKKEVQVVFAVITDMGHEFILGRPFLNEFVLATFEDPPMIKMKNGTTAGLHTEKHGYKVPVSMVEEINIPAGQTRRVYARLAQTMEKGTIGIVVPKDEFEKLIMTSLNDIRDNNLIVIEMINNTGEEKIVKKDEKIGEMEMIPQRYVVNEIAIVVDLSDAQLATGCGQETDEITPSSKSKSGNQSRKGADGPSQPNVTGIRRNPLEAVKAINGLEDGIIPSIEDVGGPPTTGDGASLPREDVGGPPTIGDGASLPQHYHEKLRLPWGMKDPGWTLEEKREIMEMLERVKFAFQSHELDHGFVKGHEVGIDTGNAEPIVMPQYRMEQMKLDAGRKLVKEFLIMRILEKSKSAWRSPLLMIKKPDGTYRMTTDLRGLNLVTKKDQFPLPRIDDMLERLIGAKHMAKLDLKNAFFQILLKKEDREKTAFVFDGALYQYRVLPQGLVHSPANLCRIMHEILHPYTDFAFPYMDDVAIIGSTFKELVENCEKVFSALGAAGMKISGKKTMIGVKEMVFLGHKITPQGIFPDPQKVDTIKNWPKPKNVTQLRQFLGLTNYLRKFIPNYAAIANGLTRQTGGERTKMIIWDQSAEKAFGDLKNALLSDRLLVHPDFSDNGGIFRVRVDASKVAEGGILYQEQNGTNRVISYASRVFTASERNALSNPERESHAIMWALTKVWRHILIGRKFEVYSDHKPCLALKGLTKLTNERMQRWAAALATFDYTAFYAKGSTMQDCDALSRSAYINYDPKTGKHPSDKTTDQTGIDVEEIEIRDSTYQSSLEFVKQWKKMVDKRVGVSTIQATQREQTSLLNVKDAQWKDTLLHDIICMHKDRPSEMFKTTRKWKNKINRFVGASEIEDELLYHTSGPLLKRLWVPTVLHAMMLKNMHDVPQAGHLGMARTYQRLQYNYFWLGMRRDVMNWVSSCEKCGQFNTSPRQKVRAPQYTGPMKIKAFERVAMDVMGPFTKTTNGNLFLFTITDIATRWCEVIPIQDQTALTLAKVFITKFCLKFGPPRTILTDRHQSFLSELMTSVCQILEISHNTTSAYHYQANAVSERAHAVFQHGLAKLVDFRHTDWDEVIEYVAHAYRTTPHAGTGYSPYFLAFGQECTEFVDTYMLPAFHKSLKQMEWNEAREEYIARLQLARDVAWDRVKAEQRALSQPSVPIREFEVGDKVRIRNFEPKKKNYGPILKWRSKFIGPYTIIARNGPTEYTVQNDVVSKDRRRYNVDDIKLYREFALRSALFSGQYPSMIPPMKDPDQFAIEEEVERVLDCKMENDKKLYLVRFAGVDMAFDQWLHESLMFCPKKIAEYEARTTQGPKIPKLRMIGPKRPLPREFKSKATEVSAIVIDEQTEISMERIEKLEQRYRGKKYNTKMACI